MDPFGKMAMARSNYQGWLQVMSDNLNQATAKYRTLGGPFGPENAAGSSLDKSLKLLSL